MVTGTAYRYHSSAATTPEESPAMCPSSTTAALLLRVLLPSGDGIVASLRALQRIVRVACRAPRLRTSGIEAINDRVAALDDQRDFPVAECVGALPFTDDSRQQRGPQARRLQRVILLLHT